MTLVPNEKEGIVCCSSCEEETVKSGRCPSINRMTCKEISLVDRERQKIYEKILKRIFNDAHI